ncbi:PepSY-associated TM helix domain-containing protein [Allosphingosinicella sp.]|uniref:PepSY-associated TM helix domain-containing protein n=1 Tax=Allosphingosinicella sp. TaxID=2823234 RepID=UPI002FC0FF95
MASGRRGKSRLRPALRWVHATFGLFAALYLLMAAATGTLLLFKPEILSLVHPELGTIPADTISQAQRLADRLEPGSFTSIKFPDETLRTFIVYLPDHRTALYDPISLAPLEDRLGLVRAMDWLFELHHYLLAGETGKLISGAFGLAIAGLVLIGLYLWWPWRRGWRLSNARAKRPTHASHLAAHTTLGILMAPALFLAALSGGAIVFHEQATSLLTGAFGKKDPTVDVPAARGSLAVLSHARFPKAEPRLYIPPAEAGGTATLRLRQPEERHPNGRSTFSWDPASATATAATSEPESGAGNRLYNLLYPLHTGVLGGLTLRVIYLVSAIIALFAAVHALRSWFRKGRRR